MNRHWSEDSFWTEALEQYSRICNAGTETIVIDLRALQECVFNGDGPAYKLMDAMVSVHEREGMDGFRGAPRLVLALLANLAQHGKTVPSAQDIYAKKTVSISEFKKNPSAVMRSAKNKPVAVMSHNETSFYAVQPAVFEAIIEHLADEELLNKLKGRLEERGKAINVDLNDI